MAIEVLELVMAGLVVLVIVAFLFPSRGALALRFVLLAITGLATVGAAAVALFFLKVGMHNHWTSDGPGMLGVMIGIPFCSVVSLVSGGLFLSILRKVRERTPPPEQRSAGDGSPRWRGGRDSTPEH